MYIRRRNWCSDRAWLVCRRRQAFLFDRPPRRALGVHGQRDDPAAGRLHAHAHINSRPGAGPRFKAFHPSGLHLYVNHELDNTVVVYDYDAVSGMLYERQIIETLPPTAPESAIAGIQISPAGD